MKRFILIFIAVMGIYVSLFAQKRKEISTPVTVDYCLPKVSYLLKVKMEYTKFIPGPFQQYAEKELGVKPEITTPREQWDIISINIEPRYVADESASYSLSASGDYNPVLLSLSPEGFLAGVGAGPLAMKVADPEVTYKAFKRDVQDEVDITALNTYNPLKEVLDTNYTYQEIDGVMKKIWDPIIRYTSKTESDVMNEAVKEIFRIRSERVRLIAAENEVADGKSLEVILKEFDRMEKDYLSLFMGKSVHQLVERSFLVSPEKENTPVLAFRFSETEGIAAKKNVSATAYSLVVENLFIPYKKAEETATAVSPVVGIQYRIPAVGDVKLIRANEELQRFRAVIPQLGVIKTFPVDVIGNEGLILEFYPEYGSLKSVSRK
ncbi:DUF4831 family protein [uncultured Odoribacter sp.]|uniref:DUF4831 family protein n=1 Tax=uncultured Odoribacter sp. TaxID=876416 RepID=UPI002624AC48|nr:DUF4831 family protein [uncultured Odoribacter sp.]